MAHPATEHPSPGATDLRPLSCELTLRQYLRLKEAQQRLSAELGHEVELAELLEVLFERFLVRHRGGGSADRLLGDAPNVRQPSGAPFSSA